MPSGVHGSCATPSARHARRTMSSPTRRRERSMARATTNGLDRRFGNRPTPAKPRRIRARPTAYAEDEEPIKAVWSLAKSNGSLYACEQSAGMFRSEDAGQSQSISRACRSTRLGRPGTRVAPPWPYILWLSTPKITTASESTFRWLGYSIPVTAASAGSAPKRGCPRLSFSGGHPTARSQNAVSGAAQRRLR